MVPPPNFKVSLCRSYRKGWQGRESLQAMKPHNLLPPGGGGAYAAPGPIRGAVQGAAGDVCSQPTVRDTWAESEVAEGT